VIQIAAATATYYNYIPIMLGRLGISSFLLVGCVWGFSSNVNTLKPFSLEGARSAHRQSRHRHLSTAPQALSNHQIIWSSQIQLASTGTSSDMNMNIQADATTKTNVTLSFPSFLELMNLSPGECVTSEPFLCGSSRFRVKLYPKGGGHRNKKKKVLDDKKENNEKQGFGMSYAVLPRFGQPPDQKVGVYLEYLADHSDDTVDATFVLRLQGNQRQGQGRRKFNVEWRAGMRFVDLAQTNLAQGCANDFGASLMQTPLLKEFMGISDDQMDDPTPLTAEIEVTIHDATSSDMTSSDSNDKEPAETTQARPFFTTLGEDIRTPPANSVFAHDPERVRVGKIVVPILGQLSQRPRMFALGAYPGVEYRILGILHDGKERFTSCPGCNYELIPIYPLVKQLKRSWPVTVPENEIPKLYTQNMYNAVSALGSLFAAFSALSTAFVVSQAISLFFIPSRSMDPTLQVGDVLLVEKVTPRVFHQRQKVGDVVLFSPPSKLRDIVAANGGKLTSRDLFVKRIAAESGDDVTVDASGKVLVNNKPAVGRRDLCQAEPLRLIEKYVKPREQQRIEADQVFVMGDCSSVSIDSRVWGPLQSSEIVGKPILRLWPMERFGPIPPLPVAATMESDWND
jgi:signal peptidase I